MMNNRYVSPIPTEERFDYRQRTVDHDPVKRRLHLWPQGPCNPAACRECEREATWTKGQTHGQTDR